MDERAMRLKIIAAFSAVYFAWGSTFLAIRFAVESIPPFFMAAGRFIIAGALLYVYARWRGAAAPTIKQWIPACIIGTLLLVIGNGSVVLAEQTVASSVVSLLIAMVPVYFALLEWCRPGGKAPGARVGVGLLVGMLGLVLLIGPANLTGASKTIDLRGVSYVLVGSLCWSIGSIYSRFLKSSDSPAMGIAMQTLAAGLILSFISIGMNEPQHINFSAISLRSILSLAYLIVFGSIIGFSAYVWLLQNVRPTLVSTYAYVNPVVAVFLGWAVAGEAVSTQTIGAAAVILCAVWIISRPAAKPAVVKISPPQLVGSHKS